MKISHKLTLVVAGLSLSACSMFKGENTFMAYEDLQTKVRQHDDAWKSAQPKLARIDALEAQVASLKQKNDTTMKTFKSIQGASMSDSAMLDKMPKTGSGVLPTDETRAANNVAPAVNTVSNNVPSVAKINKTKAYISKTASGYGVQIASYGSREEAARGWRVLKKKSPNVYKGLVPRVNKKQVKGRTMYQLKIGPFTDKSYSSSFCSMLKDSNQDCLVSKYNGEAL